MKKLTKAQKKKMWKIAGWSAFGFSAFMVARESYLVFGPNREERRKLYEAAAKQAAALNRPLVVLGDPDGGLIHHMLGRDFQCGNVCIDPKGCGACEIKQLADDPIHALSQMGNGSAVIFDSGLFAFSDDGYALAQQLLRVSGGAGNLFMFDVPRFSLTAWFEGKRKRVLTSAPPWGSSISWKNGLFSPEPTTHERSGSVALSGLGSSFATRIQPTSAEQIPLRFNRLSGSRGGRTSGLGYGAGPQSMYYYERLVERYPPPAGEYFTF